jgi:CubicO group peptidase (beta-lactamase class C family)
MRRDLILLLIVGCCATDAFAQTESAAGASPPALVTPTTLDQPIPATSFAGFDEWVQSIMEEWNVPGVAVGAIKGGEVVVLEGYGYRDLENELPVTPRTLMAIGSNSKSFTVVLMGQLVDSGQLDWDKPVRDFLPSFRLHDEYATSNMRVRDLVTHVSGLPRHDLLWYGRSLDRQALFDRLQYLEPTTSFRGRWQYQNLMFMTAGYLIEQITGQSWDTRIDERIFTPLGMTRSNTSVSLMPQSDDFAYPYVLRDGELTRVPFRNIDNVGPAGSVNSSVEEMLAYMQLHLDSGVVGRDTVLSERNAVLMQTAQSAVGSRDQYAEIGPATYGLGLGVTTYRGHKQVSHGGGIDGFISAMGWLPNDGIGVMVLSNMSGETNPVPTLIQRRVFDELLALEPIDWNTRVRKDYEEERQRLEEERKQRKAERVAGTLPSHDLAAYAGAYEHPAYGRMVVTVLEDALQVRYDPFEVDLTHYHYDVFEIKDTEPGVPLEGRVQFLMDTDGKIDRLAALLEPALDPIVFRRVKEEV